MKIIKQNGQDYLKIGSRAVPFTLDKNGKPVIKPIVSRTKDENGKEHVTINIPCLTIKLHNNK